MFKDKIDFYGKTDTLLRFCFNSKIRSANYIQAKCKVKAHC